MGRYDFELDLSTVNTMSIINGWIQPGSRVLEFGPADGRLTSYLSQERNCDVTIVELDAESGAKAAKYAKNSYVGSPWGDIEKFCWLNPEEQYDAVIFADVLEHLHDPKTVLEKCAEVLSEDGFILLSVPNLGHNSVLIDLMNDRFQYAETGLLDSTHIHFFTYHSLVQMIRDSGYYAEEILPVYSRVGDNEIAAKYTDVPISVERFLRKRAAGSVYQFVCRIGRKENQKNWDAFDLPFLEECSHLEEAQLFYQLPGQTAFCAEQCLGNVISVDRDSDILFPLPPDVRKVRFDPLSIPAVVQVKSVMAVRKDGSSFLLKPEHSTADLTVHHLYFFGKEDPQIIYTEWSEEEAVEAVRITFRILNCLEQGGRLQDNIAILEKEIEEVMGELTEATDAPLPTPEEETE